MRNIKDVQVKMAPLLPPTWIQTSTLAFNESGILRGEILDGAAFLKSIWPRGGLSDINIVLETLARVRFGEAVEAR